jgi:hypothetical protein
MSQDERDILDVLKFELNFLKKGGYGRSPREPWRAQLFFEDSPSCMNYDTKGNPTPCSECALMPFVPPESRDAKVPCRQIPLNQSGQTLSDLYQGGTQQEIEDAMADWLRKAIAEVEADREKKTGAKATSSQEKNLKPVAH